MSFFLSMFKSNLRSRLTGWRTWLLLLLLPDHLLLFRFLNLNRCLCLLLQ